MRNNLIAFVTLLFLLYCMLFTHVQLNIEFHTLKITNLFLHSWNAMNVLQVDDGELACPVVVQLRLFPLATKMIIYSKI